jgi:hypothetical protein
MSEIIGAEHEFHDPAFVAGWAERFVPTPERLALFDLMLAELRSALDPDAVVVELGIGPGYLAEHLLRALPEIRYRGVDFSIPMLDIARGRLSGQGARVEYVQADLLASDWPSRLDGRVDAIVSTWALHDLGDPAHTESVYRGCAGLLPAGGLFLNGDFIKPDGTRHAYEPGRFEIGAHLEMLRRVGFGSADCLALFEHEVEAPTPAQNYACLKGVV